MKSGLRYGLMEKPISRLREEQKVPDNSYLSRFLDFFKRKIYAVLGVERMVDSARKEFAGYIAPNVHQDTVVQLVAAQREIEESKVVQEDATAQLEGAQKEAEGLRAQLNSAQEKIEELREVTKQAVQRAKAEFRDYIAPDVHQNVVTQLETARREIDELSKAKQKRKVLTDGTVELDRSRIRRFSTALIKHPMKEQCGDSCTGEFMDELGIGLFIVGDGVSGKSDHYASNYACDNLRSVLRKRLLNEGNSNIEQMIREEIEIVSKFLFKKGAATTLELAMYDSSSQKLHTAHLGDSRMYLVVGDDKEFPFEGKEVKQFTKDHSYGQGKGPSTCLGARADDTDYKLIDLSTFDNEHIFLFMCTDGLTEVKASKQEIARVFHTYKRGEDLDIIINKFKHIYYYPYEMLKLLINLNVDNTLWKNITEVFQREGYPLNDSSYDRRKEVLFPLLESTHPEHLLWRSRFVEAHDETREEYNVKICDDLGMIVVDLKGSNRPVFSADTKKAPRRKRRD